MTKWLEKILKSNKKLGKIYKEDNAEDKPVKITNLDQYRKELEKGTTDFDFSELNMEFENIQNINLENLNLDINLRDVFVPYNGSGKIGNNVVTPMFSSYSGDYYLKINNSRLGGNNVTGDLTLFEGNQYCKPVYVWYSEETFDDNYKSKYPQFFISKDAPEELRQKYYNPEVILKTITDEASEFSDQEETRKQVKCFRRQTLTLDEYLKYYEFLKGKYLGNFSISKQDLNQIEIIELYGLEQRETILEYLNDMKNNIDKTVYCEEVIVNQADDKGAVLTIKIKFRK